MRNPKLHFVAFKKGISIFGQNISTLVNFLLLSVVYLIGVGFTSILSKLLKKEFLDTKLSKDKKTYWSKLDLKKESIEKHMRQF